MKFLRKFNIKPRLMASLIIGIVVISAALSYSSRIYSEYLVKKQLFNYLKVTQSEIGLGLEYTLDEANSLAIRLLENDSIYNLLSDKSLPSMEKQKRLREILNNLSIDKQIIGEIFILTKDGNKYNFSYNDNNLQEPDDAFTKQIKDINPTLMWGPIIKDSNGDAYLLAYKKYRNFFTEQDLGYLVLYIRESAINNIYNRKTPYSGYSFIMSNDNNIISHPDKTKVGSIIFDYDIFNIDDNFQHYSKVLNNESSIIAISKFDDKIGRLNCNWKIVSIIKESTLFSIIRKINYYIALIVSIISLLALFISLKISSQIVNPIKRLKKKLKNFGKEDTINLAFYSKTGDEIWALEKSYNDMTSRISNLIQKNNEEKEKQRELELIALQAQINPHFLYNTLDAIGWIAKLKKQKDIEKLVLALAGFFRISLHKGDKFITVSEEIELVKSFVTIDLIRFPDKFDIKFNIDEDILDLKILKITLQPIVENAIKHGLSPKSEYGHIIVKGKRIHNGILLEVIDDGIGFNPTEVFLNEIEEQKLSGYGLKNVDERIKLEYGNEYGIKIYSEINVGTTVEIRLGML